MATLTRVSNTEPRVRGRSLVPMSRRTIIRVTTLALTVAAFAGSYRHGIEWVNDHGVLGRWAELVAALPEVMVLIAVLAWRDRPRDPRVWTTGISAVAWTLWANGAAAASGLSGMVVALWPAWAALCALTLVEFDEPPSMPEPEPRVLTPAQPKPRPRPESKPPRSQGGQSATTLEPRVSSDPTESTEPEPRISPAATESTEPEPRVPPDPTESEGQATRVAWLILNPQATVLEATQELGVSRSTIKRDRRLARAQGQSIAAEIESADAP